MCFGGSAPAAPAPPPPPQAAQTPAPGVVRASTAGQIAGVANSTLLTGSGGAPLAAGQLGSKSLLGS
jgi:hypothetical protein